jgi:Flp pilus assembly protein TadG
MRLPQRSGRDCGQRPRSGASAVELALILPVFVALVMGQIETARLGMVSQLLTTAAREGCRVAVLNGASQSDVQNRVTAVLSPAGITPTTFTISCTGSTIWQAAPMGTPITVSLGVPYANVSWLGTPFYLNSTQITGSATLSSENP